MWPPGPLLSLMSVREIIRSPSQLWKRTGGNQPKTVLLHAYLERRWANDGDSSRGVMKGWGRLGRAPELGDNHQKDESWPQARPLSGFQVPQHFILPSAPQMSPVPAFFYSSYRTPSSPTTKASTDTVIIPSPFLSFFLFLIKSSEASKTPV